MTTTQRLVYKKIWVDSMNTQQWIKYMSEEHLRYAMQYLLNNAVRIRREAAYECYSKAIESLLNEIDGDDTAKQFICRTPIYKALETQLEKLTGASECNNNNTESVRELRDEMSRLKEEVYQIQGLMDDLQDYADRLEERVSNAGL